MLCATGAGAAGSTTSTGPWAPAGVTVSTTNLMLLPGTALMNAAQRGLLSIASVLTALYPAVTVVLAAIVVIGALLAWAFFG